MADRTLIAAGSTLRGLLRGEGFLIIEGGVYGEVEITGDVTIEAGALVKATVRASRIIVRGSVAGDLLATESLSLEEGARVVGNLSAPSIGIAEGALVRGRVETGNPPETPAPRAVRATTPAVTATRTSAPVAAPARVAAPAPVPPRTAEPAPARAVAAVRPAPPTARGSAPVTAAPAAPPPRPAEPAPPRQEERKAPPPPVVPALKKGTKASLKKKAGG